jgi:hypothetical protein
MEIRREVPHQRGHAEKTLHDSCRRTGAESPDASKVVLATESLAPLESLQAA